MTKKNVIIDCERMKYPYTGLFTFCKQLSQGLSDSKAQDEFNLSFYTPESSKGFLGTDQQYLIQRSLHKIINPFHVIPAIWHCTYQGSNYFSFNKKQKKLLTIHDLNFMHDTAKTEKKQSTLLKALQRKVNAADHISFISKYTANFVEQYIDVGSKPFSVIYNGCDVNIASSVPERPIFLNQKVPFIFSIGTIARKKNFHVLLSLLAGNNRVLIIAGIYEDKAYVDEIINAAKKLGVQDRLLLPGAISESNKWWLMQNMDAFVFPSLAEGFGIPVVEAMHFSAPVILSPYTSLPEIGGEQAYYFKNFEPADMLQTLEAAIEDFNTDVAKIKSMNERAASFSWSASTKAYLNIYRQLAEM